VERNEHGTIARVFVGALERLGLEGCARQSSKQDKSRETMRLISKIFNLNDPGWGRGNNNNSNGGSEPPRRPGQNEGPPDLDEVWRDFNNKLGSLFGRKPRRGGGGFGGGNGSGGGVNLPKGSPKLFVVLGVVIVGLWLASGFIIVQEGQVAVVTRFGQYTKTLSPGLQWRLPAPIENQPDGQYCAAAHL